MTVVHVVGSSYRKPGARMLLTFGGERAGTVSGGCLEAEVSRKAWWLTRNGPAVAVYQSSFDEDGSGPPYGLGCGGTLSLLLEREPHEVLHTLAEAQESGLASVVVHRLSGSAGTVGSTTVRGGVLAGDSWEHDNDVRSTLRAAVAATWAERASRRLSMDGSSVTQRTPADAADEPPAAWVEFVAPPPRLTIFGAGDDAQPLARFVAEIGWRVVVADGRRHLLRTERFPSQVELLPLRYGDADRSQASGGSGEQQEMQAVETGVAPGEFAVVLTHSYEQDRDLLCALLPAGLRYLGLLGPRHRTARLLEEVAPLLGWTAEQCWSGLHSPVGLDLGTRDPATIALAIAAELQATATARSLHVTRQPVSLPS